MATTQQDGIEIVNVWNYNLAEEFDKIMKIIDTNTEIGMVSFLLLLILLKNYM